MKRFEILKSLPPYGPDAVRISESGTFISEGYVVKFFRNDGSFWIGNFQTGATGFSGIFEFQDSSNVLVIANGNGYLITFRIRKSYPIFLFTDRSSSKDRCKQCPTK